MLTQNDHSGIRRLTIRWKVLSCLLILIATASLAGLIPIGVLAGPEPESAKLQSSEIAPKNPKFLMIQNLLEQEKEKLGLITARLESIEDPDQALALEMEAEDLKKETRVRMMELQLEWAREIDDEKSIRNLEAVLERMPRPSRSAGSGEPIKSDQ